MLARSETEEDSELITPDSDTDSTLGRVSVVGVSVAAVAISS